MTDSAVGHWTGPWYNRRVRRGAAAVLASAALLALVLPVGARGAITVANTNDEGPGSLRQAIADAPPGETISVPAGNYALTGAELAINKSLSIAGAGTGDTVVRSTGAFRVFMVTGVESQVTLSGMTIRDGRADGSGGGIYNQEATLTLRDVNVTANVANRDGEPGQFGGIADGGGVYNQGGSLSLIDSAVTANHASAVGGSEKFGGIAIGGGVYTQGQFTMERATISGNSVDTRGGQGPSNGSQFGGIGEGGGLAALVESDSRLSDSTVSGNTADSSAGPGGFAGISEGGGILLLAGDSQVSISRLTVTGNTARGLGGGGITEGGGLMYSGKAGTVTSTTLANNSVEGSTATGGNLVIADEGTTVQDTIVSGGAAASPGTENCGSEVESAGFNLESADQCGFHASGDRVNSDPQLGPLQDNGGPTQTMSLAATSPAVDQGSAPGQGSDQRGVLRPIDFPTIPNSATAGADGSDIGAFELQPASEVFLGKLKRNKKKGAGLLTVRVPVPALGTLTLSGKGLRKKSKPVSETGVMKFAVVGKRGVKRALKRRGKRKVNIKVSYSPVGNDAVTVARKVKLIKRSKAKHRRRHRR